MSYDTPDWWRTLPEPRDEAAPIPKMTTDQWCDALEAGLPIGVVEIVVEDNGCAEFAHTGFCSYPECDTACKHGAAS